MPTEGQIVALNAIRESVIQENALFAKQLPAITPTTPISAISGPIFEYKALRNAWVGALVNKIMYTQYNTKMLNNPLASLEDQGMPMGFAGELVHINPAKARQFNSNDFLGLLAKYEPDVKSQYIAVNSDLQYCVTISYKELKKALRSYDTFEGFTNQLSQSLFNGSTYDKFQLTKGLVSRAYEDGDIIQVQVTKPTDETTGKAFVKKARSIATMMGMPSSNYNAYKAAGGEGNPVVTNTAIQDIVFLIRADYEAEISVDVLAAAFNIDRTVLLGNIIIVDNFDTYDEEGNKVVDGSKIVAMMADRTWFQIKNVGEEAFEDFYNPNNRTWQYYLNVQRIYDFNIFANAVLFVTEESQPTARALSFNHESETMEKGAEEGFDLSVYPNTANVELTYTIVSAPTGAEEDVIELTPSSDTRNVKVKVSEEAAAGTYVLQAETAEGIKTTMNIVVLE